MLKSGVILQDILRKNSYLCVQGSDIITITGIAYDSRRVLAGNVFFAVSKQCYKDVEMIYVKEAIIRGAVAIIWEESYSPIYENLKKLCEEVKCVLILVKEIRHCMANAASLYYGEPQNELITIGITGTKGKSTTAGMIHQILNKCNVPCGLIGTNGAYYADTVERLRNTTPESVEVFRLLRDMIDNHMKVVVMEVSSQGLKMARVEGIVFDYAIFTNLGPDHIGEGEHADFEEYIQCKSKLFQNCKEAWFNKDDPYVYRMTEKCLCNMYYYSMKQPSDHYAIKISSDSFKTQGFVEEVFELRLPGRYNVYNALAAIGVLYSYGIPAFRIKAALKDVTIDGRMEKIELPCKITVIIDYAHNATSLEALLLTLKEYHPKRLIAIFGCGGNRSKDRRFLMGEVSGRYADLTIITSDNPRDEKPQDIMADIVTGIQRTNGQYICIEDRRQAVSYALQHAKPGDMIVLAGKGHEDYQEIQGVRYPMLDRELVNEAITKEEWNVR